MVEEETVYADWDKMRVAGPALAGVLVLALIGIFVVRSLASGDDEQTGSVDNSSTTTTVVTLPEPVDDPQARAQAAVDAFAVRLGAGRLDEVVFAFADGDTAQEDYDELIAPLGEVEIEVAAGLVTIADPANGEAPLTVSWTLADGVEFTTEGIVDVVLVGTDWLVDWETAVLERSLDPGDTLVWERVTAPRAPILDRAGRPLVDNLPVVEIGVVPRQAGEIGPLTEALGELIGADPAAMQAAIAPSPSDSLVPLATRRPEEIASVEAQLRSLPGVVLEDGTFPLTPYDRFGRALLGRSAEVTAEILEESPDHFIPGDTAGRSGLQRLYNERLAGLPGFQVRIERRFPTVAPSGGSDTDSGTDTDAAVPVDPDVVYLEPPIAGTPLNLTVDLSIQNAAEIAVAQTTLPSSLVAVEVGTGNILAVANGPGVAVNNFAMTGQYPPGSIFKVVTAYGAMVEGMAPSDPVDCPFDLTVDGRTFRNAEGEVLGTVGLRQAFVLSCNTAFINVGNRLDPSDFPAYGRALGLGAEYSVGTSAFSGNVPTPGTAVDKAATAFGQGRTLVSPLSAAVMAASVASGAYHPPRLVVDEGDAPPTAEPLDGAVAENLRQMMRAVVTNGTGRAVANVPGGPVSGKTGTAEFGNEVPPKAHAWFVGYQNDIAFAVLVEEGEFGGATAAPIAGTFLSRLAG